MCKISLFGLEFIQTYLTATMIVFNTGSKSLYSAAQNCTMQNGSYDILPGEQNCTPVRNLFISEVDELNKMQRFDLLETNDDYFVYFDKEGKKYHYVLINSPMERIYDQGGLLKSETFDNGMERYYEKTTEQFNLDQYGNKSIGKKIALSKVKLPDLSWRDYSMNRELLPKGKQKDLLGKIKCILNSDLTGISDSKNKMEVNSNGDLVEHMNNGNIRIIFKDGDMIEVSESLEEIELALPHYSLYAN